MQIHATAVGLESRAVLLCGPSGSGKSDLALRLIAHGWTLIADDRSDLWVCEGVVRVRCPEPLRGRIEVRGIGILDLPCAGDADVALLCDLKPGPCERLPELRAETVLGRPVRRITLDPFEASAPAKLTLLLRYGMVGP